jgi:hypothetical protein
MDAGRGKQALRIRELRFRAVILEFLVARFLPS